MKKIFFLGLIINLILSCKTQNLIISEKETDDFTAFSYDKNYQYQIRKDDKISISVWGEDSYSIGSIYGNNNSGESFGKWLLVDPDGNIEIPKLGTTQVLDKTVLEIKKLVKNKLKDLLINPIIDIRILNKEVTILGEVKNPNTYPIDKDNNSLLEIISKSGGFDVYANLKSVKVIRKQGESIKMTHIDLTKSDTILNRNIQIHPGDIVIVPSKKIKEFDKRISTIMPFTTMISTIALILGIFKN
jgi:polysaccharide export outer membrane protein